MTGPARRILLAEDDRFLRKAAESTLRQNGFTVLTAADGEEALRLARTEGPDLILLDLIMPKLQGFEVLRTLRSTPTTPPAPSPASWIWTSSRTSWPRRSAWPSASAWSAGSA